MARTLQVESINSSLTGLDLTTAGVSRLFITNSGNVGINTISASSLFEVNGDITISDKIIHAGDTNTFIRFVTSDTVSIDTAGSERFRITSNGGIAFGGAANYGTTAHVLKSAGDSAPVWGFIGNANVDSGAAIAYSKLNLANSITSNDIVDGAIVNGDINASAAISYSKLATLSSGNIVLGSSANVATSTAVTGDVTISNTGVTSIASLVIVNDDISATAGIVDTKLATISTAGKVSNSATTATSANTASAIVARDASNNFVAGTITASLTGNATSATSATTASTANALNTANNYQVNILGVGTAPSATAGEIRATNNITAYYSDERLKNFIGKISNALDKVNSLNGYFYKENSKAKELGYNSDSVQVGVSAQEVEKILPEIVTLAPIDCSTDSTGKTTSKTGQNYKTVYYEKLIPLLIEAIKELSLEVEKLKHK